MTRAALFTLLCLASVTHAAEPVDLDVVTRIREEALSRSQVMETAAYLCDLIGPRLTASPQAKQANEWARRRLAEWGLANARLESWGPFAPGWSLERVSVRMLAPTVAPLLAIPQAWSPGTNGPLRARAVKAKIESEEDFAKHKGKLAGRIVLLSDAKDVPGEDKPPLTRFSKEQLAELGQYEIPPARRLAEEREDDLKRARFRRALRSFLAEEKTAAAIAPSGWAGLVRVGGTGFRPGEPRGVPSLVMLTEHYNRLARLVDRKLDVELELDVAATFHEQDSMGYNTLAEIPGSDKAEEVVLAGAHLDSWHGGTGATDNAAGVAVVMEAARILKALGLEPRRTIRFALWTGEEQTYGGSEDYLRRYLAERADPEDPAEKELSPRLRTKPGRLTLKPGHGLFSAYFNVDNGSGRIRGIQAQDNAAVVPVFQAWLEPFADLGATQVTLRRADDTDHEPFDDAGLPAFQFIQDDLEYSTRTWHTNLDVYDRLKREDLMQASAVLASFLYHAAQREALLPRKPLPREAVKGE